MGMEGEWAGGREGKGKKRKGSACEGVGVEVGG